MRRCITALAALLIVSCGSQEKAANGSAAGNEAGAAQPATSGGTGTESGGGGGAATASLTPGEYETRVEVLRINMVNGPNLPAGITTPVPPPTVARSCLTADKARRPDANFLTGSGAQGGCTYENLSMEGGRIQGAVTCSSEGTRMRTTMNGQFGADGYSMESESRVEAGGMTMETASRITTRRIGDCPGA